MLFGFVIVTLIALFYLSLTWKHYYLLNEIGNAETELQIMENERELLRLDVSQAFSLRRIESIARRDLRMESPEVSDGSLNFLRLLNQ
jgi:cell division protein FtsL